MERWKSREAQGAFILCQVNEGATVGEVCRKAETSEATFYIWRRKYAGLMPSEMKRLRQLEVVFPRVGGRGSAALRSPSAGLMYPRVE